MILDPVAASAGTGVPLRTIQRWANLGRIINHGDEHKMLVDVNEVVELQSMRTARRDRRLPRITGVA